MKALFFSLFICISAQAQNVRSEGGVHVGGKGGNSGTGMRGTIQFLGRDFIYDDSSCYKLRQLEDNAVEYVCEKLERNSGDPILLNSRLQLLDNCCPINNGDNSIQDA